jgi:hypothetical protein
MASTWLAHQEAPHRHLVHLAGLSCCEADQCELPNDEPVPEAQGSKSPKIWCCGNFFSIVHRLQGIIRTQADNFLLQAWKYQQRDRSYSVAKDRYIGTTSSGIFRKECVHRNELSSVSFIIWRPGATTFATTAVITSSVHVVVTPAALRSRSFPLLWSGGRLR